MDSLWKTALCAAGAVFLTGSLAAAQAAEARPGTVNYVEGQVTLDGRAVAAKDAGSADVEAGHVLATGQGKVEMLLTPGVFLRLGDHSSVEMVTPSLTDTRVRLLTGKAMVEADLVLKENHLDVTDHGAQTWIQKNGVYEFTTDPPSVAVYDGKVQVTEGDRTAKLGKGKEVMLPAPNAPLKAQKFDRNQTGALYQWSSARSEYLAQANQSSVQNIVVGSPWWDGMGWYWNPWYDTWAFVPGDGFLFSPFGYGFYSPAYWRFYPPLRFYDRPGHIVINRQPAMRAPFLRSPGARGGIMRGPAMRGPAMRAPAMRAPMMRGRMGGGMRGGGRGR